MVLKSETKEKFAGYQYPIQVVGRHVDISSTMKEYAVEKLTRIERFGGHVIDATIVMDIQKQLHCVDFIINVNNTIIKVTGTSDNMYAAVDQAMHHLKHKLGRYVRKLHEHHNKGLTEVDMTVNVLQRMSDLDAINDQIDEENLKKIEEETKPPKVVAQETRRLKTLNLSEAVMKMELSEDFFMVYRSEEDHKLKVIYKRKDGYGIIEVEK